VLEQIQKRKCSMKSHLPVLRTETRERSIPLADSAMSGILTYKDVN
jgi:hypothetical protein